MRARGPSTLEKAQPALTLPSPAMRERWWLLGFFRPHRHHLALGDPHLGHGLSRERQPPTRAGLGLHLQEVAGAEIADVLDAAERLALRRHDGQTDQVGDVELV